MKRSPYRVLENHWKKPKKVYWWEKPNPVIVYYRAIGKDGQILVEDRSPTETVGRTLKDEVDHYERIECYQVTPGWKKWKPSQKLIDDPDTQMWLEVLNEEDDEDENV